MLRLATVALFASAPAFASTHDVDLRHTTHTDPFGVETRLARVGSEVVVDAAPERVWAALAEYGEVHTLVGAITDSSIISEDPTLGVGCERFCASTSARGVEVKERIIAYEEGSFYTYEVYESVGFPSERFFATFGIRVDEQGQTVLYNYLDYRLKPAIMTGFMRGRLGKSTWTSVLAYKHYVETGETGVDADRLVALYR